MDGTPTVLPMPALVSPAGGGGHALRVAGGGLMPTGTRTCLHALRKSVPAAAHPDSPNGCATWTYLGNPDVDA